MASVSGAQITEALPHSQGLCQLSVGSVRPHFPTLSRGGLPKSQGEGFCPEQNVELGQGGEDRGSHWSPVQPFSFLRMGQARPEYGLQGGRYAILASEGPEVCEGCAASCQGVAVGSHGAGSPSRQLCVT